MANRRRTIEIWDNYWKELPTLVYLIFMLSIAAQMTLVFMGGMLFFKANWLWSLLVALGTGILTYIICYLMIQAKADIQHPRGFRISFFLTLPYASLVFFGGMAACNHWGYRDMQLAEFQQSAQYISTKSRQIIRAFEEDRDDVILAITDRCKSCSKRSTSTKRDRDASRLEVCLGTSKAKACADFDSSVKSDLETFAKGKMEASSGALDSLQQLLMDIDNNGIVGHLNQYSIQERLKRAPVQLEQATRDLAASTSQFSKEDGSCINPPFSFPTSFESVKIDTDCSSAPDVFCAGWGWKPMLLLFTVILGSLMAPLFTEGWADGAKTNQINVDDSFTQGL